MNEQVNLMMKARQVSRAPWAQTSCPLSSHPPLSVITSGFRVRVQGVVQIKPVVSLLKYEEIEIGYSRTLKPRRSGHLGLCLPVLCPALPSPSLIAPLPLRTTLMCPGSPPGHGQP